MRLLIACDSYLRLDRHNVSPCWGRGEVAVAITRLQEGLLEALEQRRDGILHMSSPMRFRPRAVTLGNEFNQPAIRTAPTCRTPAWVRRCRFRGWPSRCGVPKSRAASRRSWPPRRFERQAVQLHRITLSFSPKTLFYSCYRIVSTRNARRSTISISAAVSSAVFSG
jgi:hypothetical protein